MRKIIDKILILSLLLILHFVAFSQRTVDDYCKEKRRLFRHLAKSELLDSIYDQRQLVFVENDLLLSNDCLAQGFNKRLIKICSKERLNNSECLVLASFVRDKRNISAGVSLQLSKYDGSKTLGVSMKKVGRRWKIINHYLLEE